MARKAPIKYVPLEERPSFLALVAELVNVPADQFPGAAMQCVDKYHDAVLAGHVEVLDQMEMAYTALVYQLNGGTLQGCAADDSRSARVLARALAARPGQVPRWGSAGEFLLEVEGLRVRVVIRPDLLGNHHACALWAVDLDRPFVSESGYRSAGLTATNCLGLTVDQAARALVLDLLKIEGKLKPIAADDLERLRRQKVPGWLSDALADVLPDGQLSMFGDAPKDPNAKAPMSNADRQRALRKRRADQQLKPVMLSESERHLMDKIRAMFEGAPGVGKSQEFVGTLGQANGDFHFLDSGCDVDLRSVWKSLETDFSRMAVALGLLRLRNNQHAELGRAVALLQARLRAAGLSDQISNDQKPWYWNKCPPLDYRASSAAEYMERGSQARTVDDQLYHCRRSLEQAEAENERLKAEARQRFEVNFVLRCRLRNAGLSESGEAEPGE